MKTVAGTCIHMNGAASEETRALFRGMVGRSVYIQDIFGKMLRQLPRCGAAQAQAILNLYPTIGHLVQAYDAVDTEAEKIALLANIVPRGRSRLGKSLSSTAYYFFRGRTY